MAQRGGRRPGAGRKKTKVVLPPGIAGQVLARIGELKLKAPSGWIIKNAADYALSLLESKDERIRKESFIEFCHQEYGRPMQKTDEIKFDPNAPLVVQIRHIGAKSS
jgi:hypothetical protein